MSSPSVSLTPLRQGTAKNKKRRPNFRPTSQPKAKAAAATSPAPALEDSTVPSQETQAQAKDLTEETKDDTLIVQETVENNVSAVPSALSEAEERRNDDLAVATTTKTKAKRGRKRKKTGVAVGPSRLAPKEGEDLQEETVPYESTAVADASGEPRLSTFCSKFRTKRKKKDKNASHQTPQEAALPEEETGTQQAAGPMVKVVDGEIVLQESSIEVTGGSSKPDEEYPVVEEEAQLAVVGASYNSFVSRRAPQHWTVEETQLFYEALRQVGTDFGTMEVYFGKKRTRKQLKRKYQMESTKCPQLVEAALNPTAKKEIDLSVFKVTVDSSDKPSGTAAKKASSESTSKKDSGAAAKKPAASEKTTTTSTRTTKVSKPATAKPSASEKAAKPKRTIEDDDSDSEEEPVEPLWPEVEEEDTQPPDVDPLLQEDEQPMEDAPAISLVPGATNKAKSKKPKFRSRRAKAR